jgi:hypothetical protein
MLLNDLVLIPVGVLRVLLCKISQALKGSVR